MGIGFFLIAAILLAVIFGWHYGKWSPQKLKDEEDMDFDDNNAKVVFLPSQCEKEVGELIDKFTGIESNLEMSELKDLIYKKADADPICDAIKALRHTMILPNTENLRTLSVEEYVVEIEKVMQSYVSVILNASQQGHDVVGKTEELLKQIDSIFTLVDGLRHISDQTGLLALNAAIEAARTGDVGRTYSYMAIEVQRLSVQSQNFGGDIKAEMDKAKRSVEATSALVDQVVVSDLHIALETRSSIDQLIGQLQGLAVVETLGFSTTQSYSKIIGEMHKIVVVVLMKVDLIQRLGLVDGQFSKNLNTLLDSLKKLYLIKVIKK